MTRGRPRRPRPPAPFDAIGQRIKHIREARGLTQIAAAELLGTSQKHYWSIESGEQAPSTRFVLEIAAKFEVSPADILVAPNERAAWAKEQLLHGLPQPIQKEIYFIASMVAPKTEAGEMARRELTALVRRLGRLNDPSRGS